MKSGGKLRVLATTLIVLLILSSIIAFADTTDTTTGTTSTTDDTTKPEDKGGLTKTDSTKTESNKVVEPEAISSLDWLENKTTDNIEDIYEDSLAVIALLGSDQRDISGLVDRLKSRGDVQTGCWPSGACKVKDTAIAGLAMYLSGQDEEAKAAADWLKKSTIPGLRSGEWWLVIKGSTPEGSCTVTYLNKPKTFNFKEDKITELGGKYYIGLYYIGLSQINPAILRNLLPILSVDCSNLAGSIVTLLHKPDPNTFFIQKSETAANVELKVANTCFGTTKGSSACEYESSLYATWALMEMGEFGESLEDIGDTIYLQSKIKTSNVKDLALLNRILYKSSNVAPSFVKELVSQQKQGGDWNGDVFTTSLALLGLAGNTDQVDVVNRAAAYLDRRKSPKDGSWDNNVKNTAMALIALTGVDLSKGNVASPSVPSTGSGGSGNKVENCDNGIDDDGDTFPDCGDSDCATDKIVLCNNNKVDECEENLDCGGFCVACETTDEDITPALTGGCRSNSECDSGEECVAGSCQLKEETKGCVSNSDCKSGQECVSGSCQTKAQGSLWWLWTLIIILLIAGLVFFYVQYVKTGKIDLKHLFKKKQKGPSFEEFKARQEFRPRPSVAQTPNRNTQRPMQQARRPAVGVKSKEDLELEKSLREAERVLKGK